MILKLKDWAYLFVAVIASWALYSQYTTMIEDAHRIHSEATTEVSEQEPVEAVEDSSDVQESKQERIERERQEERRKHAEQERLKKEREEDRKQEEQEEQERKKLDIEADKIAQKIFANLTDMMAGDPYNENRYIEVSINLIKDTVNVVVDENSFSNLDLNLKAKVYEEISRDVQQQYKEMRDYEPDTIQVNLFDSTKNELSSYRRDIADINDRLFMNHNNDNNF